MSLEERLKQFKKDSFYGKLDEGEDSLSTLESFEVVLGTRFKEHKNCLDLMNMNYQDLDSYLTDMAFSQRYELLEDIKYFRDELYDYVARYANKADGVDKADQIGNREYEIAYSKLKKVEGIITKLYAY